jgi:2-oxoglutarate ferredoxin oxidoreductase subunit beta
VLTGVFYVNTQKPDFSTLLNLVDEPLATLAETRTRPGREVLAKLMEAHL